MPFKAQEQAFGLRGRQCMPENQKEKKRKQKLLYNCSVSMMCVINCGTDWLKEIEENLSGHSYKIFGLHELTGCDVGSFAGVIISGAHTNLTEVHLSDFLTPFRFVHSVNVPILGICLGHQILGVLHGATVSRGPVINKQESIEVIKDDKIFSGLGHTSLFREDHAECITVPVDFDVLAQSESCHNEAMRHKKKCMYGVQFHPEVSGNNGRTVLTNFLHMCSEV